DMHETAAGREHTRDQPRSTILVVRRSSVICRASLRRIFSSAAWRDPVMRVLIAATLSPATGAAWGSSIGTPNAIAPSTPYTGLETYAFLRAALAFFRSD